MPASRMEFPLHFGALIEAFRAFRLTPFVALVYLGASGSRLRWLLVVAVGILQVLFYRAARQSGAELAVYWALFAATGLWAVASARKQPHEHGTFWSVQCVACAWLVMYSIESYNVIA